MNAEDFKKTAIEIMDLVDLIRDDVTSIHLDWYFLSEKTKLKIHFDDESEIVNYFNFVKTDEKYGKYEEYAYIIDDRIKLFYLKQLEEV